MKVGIGQDSHRFSNEGTLILGGIEFPGTPKLLGNSDADVVLHSLCNAISSITTVNVLGSITDKMCKNGITNSEEYVKEALKYLEDKIVHVAISIECQTPKISPRVEEMRFRIAKILNIPASSIGITATTGEGLTEFGKGNGISTFTIITVE